MKQGEMYHPITSAKRLDIRYSLVKIKGRSYLIDVSNPKDWRTYLSAILSDGNLRGYDITGDENKFCQTSNTRRIIKYVQHITNILAIYALIAMYKPGSAFYQDGSSNTTVILVNSGIFIGGVLAIAILSNFLPRRVKESELKKYSKWLLYSRPTWAKKRIVRSIIVLALVSIAIFFFPLESWGVIFILALSGMMCGKLWVHPEPTNSSLEKNSNKAGFYPIKEER